MAAIHLAMANTLFPRVTEGQGYRKEAHAILDEMITKGNRVAEVRKAELIHLENLMMELTMRVEAGGMMTLTLTAPEERTTEAGNHSGQAPPDGTSMMDSENTDQIPFFGDPQYMFLDQPQPANHVEFLDSIGISSYEFFSIVDHISGQDALSDTLITPDSWREGN